MTLVFDEWFDTRTIPDGDCLIWIGKTNIHGYGQVRPVKGGKLVMAHRYAYERHVGPIPKGLYVLHSCDRPPCVEPAHLSVGDQFDNMRACVARGRHVSPFRVRSKITLEQAEAIRVQYAAGGISQSALGREYGITQPNVSMIISGHIWPSPPADGDASLDVRGELRA